MSKTPRQPNRIAEYSSESSYYPRELVEQNGILKLVKEDGLTTDLNTTANTTIKDAGGSSIGTVNPKSGGTITVPDATSSIRGLTMLSDNASSDLGTASAGTATTAARSDHVHPKQTTITGNAGSATKLATARTINITGSTNATDVTATGASFNGSSNVTIKISAIAASIVTGLSTVATSGKYSDLSGTPTIPVGSTTDEVPIQAGIAAIGESANFARADHIHPAQTTISGNAATATKLATGRTINLGGVTATGVSFNGSSDITIKVTAVPAALVTGLATVATSGKYSDLTGTPSIPTASTATPKAASGSGSAGGSTTTTYSKSDHVHPVQTSVSGNAGTASKLATSRTISLSGGAKGSGSFDGSANSTISVTEIDGSKITGTIPLSSIPKGAQERLIPVANDDARLELTSEDAQNGDVIKVTKTGIMYYVVDDTKLGTEDAFSVFTAGAASSVDWTGITNKPSFATVATSGAYSDLTGTPSIPTASTTIPAAAGTAKYGSATTYARADHVHPVQTTISGNAATATKLATGRTITITGSTNATDVTATGASFDGSSTATIKISAIAASIVTGLATVATSGAYSDLTGTPSLATVATTGAYSDLSGKPTIPTASITTPLVAGTATYGSGTAYARSNHVHPLQTSVSGNAGTATKLASAKTINLGGVTATGASFDGSANATIEITAVPAALVTGLAAVATSGAYSDLTGKPTTGTASALGLTKLYTGTGSYTDGTINQSALTALLNAKASSSHTHSMGSEDAAGFTKLYASTGTATDGTMTQSAINSALSGKASSSHTHSTGSATALGFTKLYTGTGSGTDGSITQSALTTLLSNKASSSHTHTTGNATTAGFTKLYTSTGTNTDGTMTQSAIKDAIPIASTTPPKVAASTASIGTANNGYAYGDHVHPVQTTVSGNAGTATKLATARTINDVSFDGTSNITIKANPTVTNLTTEDLNTLTTTGFYYAASGNTCTNKPTSVSGFGLIVYDTDEYGQILTAGNGLMYTRTGDEDAWNAWTPIYTGTNPSPHTTITMGTNTTSSTAPSAGSSFTAIDSVTKDSNGHVTQVNTKTITIPSNAKRGYGYGTCSTAASTTAKVASVSSYTLTTGGYVTVRFTYAVPASATLNVNSTGAKSIYNNGSTIKAGVINAGDTATFVYNGSYYYLVSTSTPSRTYTANVTTTWTGSEAPYTQSITVSGMTANDNPVVDVVPDSTYATATSQIAEYGKIYKITTSANSITVYATEKTETTVPIQLKCVR